MFREMRRIKQQLSTAETEAILRAGTSGVLAVSGDDGYPYAVPISYVYADGKLYFHSAVTGHKLDSLRRNEKVSFCVIDKDEVIQQTFTTHYRSAIIFGRARVLESDEEKQHAALLLAQKYSPDYPAEGLAEIEKSWARFLTVEVTVEHMTGKAAKELVS